MYIKYVCLIKFAVCNRKYRNEICDKKNVFKKYTKDD